MKQKQINKIRLLFMMGILAVLLGVSYGFISLTLQGEKKQVLTAGTLSLELDEDENNITITDALPMYDEVGMIQEPFTFRLINHTATDTNYVIKLQEINTSNLSPADVKYGLEKDGTRTIDLVSNIKDGIIDSGTITGSDTIEYTLRLWIKDDVTEITQIQQRTLSLRFNLETSQKIESAPSVVFDTITANIGENCKAYDDGTDTFLTGQCSNNYVWYSGKLWRVVLKNNKTGATKMVTDNATTIIEYNESGNVLFKDSYVDQWLNQEFLPTLHDYEDYLEINSIWDSTEDSSETPTRPKGTTTAERTVGLLNYYEYYTTYANSDELATYSNTYLYNKARCWLLTPSSSSNLWNVHGSRYSGKLFNSVVTTDYGIRPSINLKSSIKINGGTGISTNPYILEGDLQTPIQGTTLLSTRYSGEYVTFNNELYRIVGIENGLTKIIAVDKPSELNGNIFDSSIVNFGNAAIKTDLENYYQNLATSNVDAYNMIQPNTAWYLGQMHSKNYKAGICKTVDVNISMSSCEKTTEVAYANIGLPRAGEMFTSQITKGTLANFWTLTPYVSSSGSRVYRVDRYGQMDIDFVFSSAAHGARPSMYLKSNVVIASDNTGNGTYEYPYSIEPGA